MQTTKPYLNRHLAILLSVFLSLSVMGQESIGGDALNSYYEVSGFFTTNSLECAGEDLTTLKAGDKVLLIQMTGAVHSPFSVTQNSRMDPAFGNGGKYELMSVLSVNNSTKEVAFTADFSRTYTVGESIQLVKIYEGYNAEVTSDISVPAWDGSTGGVLALVVLEKLKFLPSTGIKMSGKGFRGADTSLYTAGCRTFAGADTVYFAEGSASKSGLKGEGLKSVLSNWTIGSGNNFNGGGGGFGRYGGGGGGSNYDQGGFGGGQQESCYTNPTRLASGGYGLETGALGASTTNGQYYTTTKKITFGGGGGGSTYSPGLIATKGGSGGGIVIILADTLEANGQIISANGESVTDIATAGAGGGGAGGTILLDVAYYSGSLTINALGGDGGSTSNVVDCGGSGGSGAGGIILNSGTSISTAITYNLGAGSPGIRGCTLDNPANLGKDGDTINNYLPVLNGFTFNAISSNDTICNGQTPDLLIGTTPKGSDSYSFQWLESLDSVTWNPISIADTNKNYQPPALNDTMFYTRVVTFPSGVSDIAIPVKIIVYADLTNNILTLRDTVCRGVAPGILSTNSVEGGDNSYSYYWESSPDTLVWTPRGTTTTENLIETNELINTTFYRRKVESGPQGVCKSTSNIDTISVLPPIDNNVIENPFIDTLICINLQAGNILGSQPIDGEDGDYNYSWISSLDNISYSTIPLANGKNYNPNTLSGTRYFKRIVISGADGACVDTTVIPRLVEVLPAILGNSISSDSTRYCYSNNTQELKQHPDSLLSGGKNGYEYQWQIYSGAAWSNISGEVSSSYLPGVLTDTSEYRRIVLSGQVQTTSTYACIDTSSDLRIDVIPIINNSLRSPDENICQESQPIAFDELEATGGDNTGSFTYLWEQNPSNSGWVDAEGTNTIANYAPPVLQTSIEYRRKATSQICTHTSDTINIIVYDSIQTNSILGSPSKYTCFDSPKLLIGSLPGGGSGVPQYIWQSSVDATVWSNTGGDAQDYTTDNLSSQTYFRRIVESGDLAQCKDTSATVYIDINQLPKGDIITDIDTLCAGDEIQIRYENLEVNGPWTIGLGETVVLHTESNISTTAGIVSFSISESANIRLLSLQNDSLCFADTSLATGEIKAKIYDIPLSNAGIDSITCGPEYTMTAVPSVGVGQWISDDGVFDDNLSPTANVTVSSYGLLNFEWKETNWHCTNSDFVEISFFEQPLIVNAGEDQELAYTFETQLDGSYPDPPSVGAWKFVAGVGNFEDSTQAKTRATFDNIGEYLLRWTIENGPCRPMSDSISILVKDLELSNGFSPNGDDINDKYELDFPSGNNVKITFLDRNGNVVNIISGTLTLSWDGTNESGQQVSEDTYYYIIEEEGKPARNGFIEIRR